MTLDEYIAMELWPRSSGSMNCFLQGVEVNNASGQLNLFLVSSTSGYSYEFNNLNLYLNGDNSVSGSLNLSITGVSELASGTSYLNLYLAGPDPNLASGTIDLYTFGGTSGTDFLSNSINLYINGDGATSGYTPASGWLNLFLLGEPKASGQINLYINGYGPIEESLNLFVNGITGFSTSGVNLNISGSDNIESYVNLFVRGYTW